MVSSADSEEEKFNGSNWQALNRIIALAKFQFLQDDDYYIIDEDDGTRSPRHQAQCAYLARSFSGPALDWVASAHASSTSLFDHFDRFVSRTREAFGIASNNIDALLRHDLDQLTWEDDVPSFFAQFDRLTLALNITDHPTRIMLVQTKLPLKTKILLAEQSLDFANYDTMRERLNGMWAIDPTRGKRVTLGAKRPRCGTCGKKGHTAPDCRSAKK